MDGLRMGILSRDVLADMGGQDLPESGPAARIPGLLHPGFDVGQKVVGQDGNEEVGPGPVGGLVEDRTQAQVGLEGTEGALSGIIWKSVIPTSTGRWPRS